MNKLMDRIFSAMNNGEDLILDQLSNDIQLANEDGGLDTREYSITPNGDGSSTIHDKVNNEDTTASENQNGIELKDAPKNTNPEIKVGGLVTWKDNNGNQLEGKLVSIADDGTCTIDSNGKQSLVNKELLTAMSDQPQATDHDQDQVQSGQGADQNQPVESAPSNGQQNFSKSRARKFLVNSKGEMMAMGWESSLGKLAKEHPDWKMVDMYDLDAYKNAITKKFSSFSPENQRVFTKTYRLYAVLDKSGKLQHIVDIDNAKGLVSKNPGWTMMKRYEYFKSLQDKMAGFSDVAKKAVLDSMEGCSLSTANKIIF